MNETFDSNATPFSWVKTPSPDEEKKSYPNTKEKDFIMVVYQCRSGTSSSQTKHKGP